MMQLELDADSMYDTAAENMGKVFIATELSGGGTASATTVAIAKKGIRNVLRHTGITKGELEISETINLDMPNQDCFIFSESDGLLEVCFDLGALVKAGDLIGRVHDIKRTGTAPTDYHAKINGIFTGRHFPGQIAMGDCLAVIAVAV